jgi:predicted alpha-1,2-mannosidase
MRIILCLSLLLMAIQGFNQQEVSSKNEKDMDLTQYVNPFIGTQNMGHTYPGATTPFGMVQLSPDTGREPLFKEGKYNPNTYRYCSGYQYDDEEIYGFSHTHFSGTGHSDLGDILIMPGLTLSGEKDPKEKGDKNPFVSTFRHSNERAEAGYYQVRLDRYDIDAELTATDRCGLHRYTFPGEGEASILVDLVAGIYNYKEKNVWTFIRVENDSLITGYRQTNGWARTRKVFFAMEFSKKIKNYRLKRLEEVPYNGFYRKFNEEDNFPERAGKEIQALFDFDIRKGEQILVKVALSPTSMAGALKNLKAELPHWDFEKIHMESRAKWQRELEKIRVKSVDEAFLETFYTAMYHSMLGPIIYEDVDGRYRGLDQNIHRSDGFSNYGIFSLWDTYRALHPLFNLLHPERNNDMIHSMLAHQEQSVHHMLPVWSHYANENWCMIGYHAVSVIADALVKGTTDINAHEALSACVATASVPYFDGLGHYMEKGYVAEDLSPNSVSKTLEYAYDDWCIAQIASIAGEKTIQNQFLHRAQSFRNVYRPDSRYMQPRLSNGEWRKEFDPLDTHGQGFIEGNAWNYGLYVPHSLDEMVRMMGGQKRFSAHLDRIFTTPIAEKYIEKNEDITRDGIIGHYVHGNEPGHHIPYLYNWTGEPWKTQERVRMIMDEMYGPGPDGLCGNDDVGQMSAWYIFSALGFYPVLPGSDKYALGSPSIEEAEVRLQNGAMLRIIAHQQDPQHIYVKEVRLNGKVLSNNELLHSQLTEGGLLEFDMTSKKPL